MAEIARALEKGIGIMNSVLRYICMGLLFGMMLLGTADVTGRYLFNKPVLGTVEIFGILLPAIVLLGLAYTQGAHAHIRMEVLFLRFPPRVKTILSFITTVCMLFVSALILWRGAALIITYWRFGRVIETIGVPMFLPQILVPLGALMLCFVLIVQMLQYFIQLKKRS